MPVPSVAHEAADLHTAGVGYKQHAVKHAPLLVKVLLSAIDEFNVYSRAVIQTGPQSPTVAHNYAALLSSASL